MSKNRSLFNILCIVSVITLFFSNCNFNILIPDETPTIDSLFVLEKHNLYIGDTLHIICVAHSPNQDSLEYQWQCNDDGIIILSLNDTLTIVASGIIPIVQCKVIDLAGNNTIKQKNININLYRNYFPVEINNKWTYGSYYREDHADASATYTYRGTETWEILEISESKDTVIISLNFEGTISYFGAYSPNYVRDISANKTIKLYKNVSSKNWCLSSVIFSSDSTTPINGYNMIRTCGIPYYRSENSKLINLKINVANHRITTMNMESDKGILLVKLTPESLPSYVIYSLNLLSINF